LQPFYIEDCFCWLHPASGGRGVVLCSPIGLEDLVMHRFVRRLACELAEAGIPALRFDYRGTGDSLGSETDPDQVKAWLAGVRKAVKWLREEAGITEIALVGFRVGGLLAAQVAEQCGDIVALVLVGPVMSGTSYLREAAALNAFVPKFAAGQARQALFPDTDKGGLEVAGFTLTPATIRDLEGLDLRSLKRRPAPRILVLGRSCSRADQRLGAMLRLLDAEVTVGILPGYASMPWNSSLAVLPHDAFSGLVDWIKFDPPSAHSLFARPDSPLLQSLGWREEPVLFGSEGSLFAVHCAPVGSASRSAMLMVNHGLNRHIGWARMYVALARRLASQGIGSLRMDIAGVGDSATPAGRRERELYAKESLTDVQAAIGWLRQRGYEHITLIGHSAGAHLAFYTAAADKRVTGLVMSNLPRFFHEPEESSEMERSRHFKSTNWYLAMLRDRDVWGRLMRGDVNISGILSVVGVRYLRRLGAVLKAAYGRYTGLGLRHQLVLHLFRLLCKRGTNVLLVYTAQDSGLDELALYGGRGGGNIAKLSNVDLQIIEDADHNLTPHWARERYFALLEDHIRLSHARPGSTDEIPARHLEVSAGAC
jgi:pimeloyl-ACP methyl ester carboxylesterase